MKKLATLFTCSFEELKHVHTLTVCAMLGATAIVLGSMSLDLTPTLRIGFSGIPNEIVHYLFGPAAGSLFGGVMDIVKYLVKPSGPFFPGFTLVPMVAGLLYGLFYYRRPLSFGRVLAAHFAVMLVCNLLLNTWFLSVLYGKGFLLLLPPRLMKNLVMWPIDSFIFYQVARALEAAGVLRLLKPGRY